ncbi:MAG: phosphatase PAP2 family protein [Ignavibacterium sp.]|nr:phosphatase PAP2 family protein [Ignavibacterium sp.]MDW8375690.1 phosphatase PAP2 family protein [Ignavibacteriales bacterium]
MFEFLYNIDLTIFYFFNHTLSSPFLDKFFSFITSVNNWTIAYVILLSLTWTYGGKRGKIAIVIVIVMITFTDQLGHKLLKEFFARQRPCNVLDNVLTPTGCSGTYSFPSNHALNNFAAASFFSFLFPQFIKPLFIVASLVAISRIYLGLHFPSDIIAGAILGVIFGYIFSELVMFIENNFLRNRDNK